MGGSSKGNKTSSSPADSASKKRHRKHRNEADELDTSEHKQDLKRLRAYSGDDADVAKRVRTRSMDAAEEKKLLQSSELSPADWRKEHAITLTGHGVHRTRSAEQMPAPWTQFDHVEFDSLLVQSLKRAGFEQPTPIQAQSWPILLEPAVAAAAAASSNSTSDGDNNKKNKNKKMATRGCDVVSIAKTGSGKTLGFLMPAFYQHLQRVGRIQGYTLPKILVLAPTRELATQIMEQAQQFGRCVGIRSVCCYGGSSKYPQIAALQRGVECIIATPGRLNDLIEMGKADLSQIQFLVLDEADRMLDMGFEPQIRSIIQQTNALTRQTCLFSATWPREIQALAHEFLYNPIQINVGQVNALVANKDIQQTVIMMQEEDKFAKLEEILNQLLQQHHEHETTTGGGNNTNRDQQQRRRRHTNGGIPIANIGSKDHAKVIVFVAKKVSCHDLANRLWDDGYAVDSLHGDRPQWERTKVMQAFKSGPLRMLIATDVCARGLDVKDIGVVVNYDMPAGVSGVEDYVHRIGRTGRAGRKGVAYTFFTPSDKKNATKLVQVLKQSQQEIPAALQAMVRPPPRAGGGGRGYYGRGGGGRGGGRGYMSGGGGRGYMSGGRGGYGGGGRGGYGRGGGRGGYGRGRGGGGRGYRR